MNGWRTVLICCRRAATTVVTAAPLHRHFAAPLQRHFAAAPHPSERRERTLTAKEKLGKKMAVQHTLDSFRRRRKPIAARLESAKDEKRKGIPLKPGSPSETKTQRTSTKEEKRSSSS